MEAQTAPRRAIETALIEKCWKDAEFRKAVVSDPKGTLERYTGQKLPPQLKIVIHEEDANTLHLTIPPAPNNIAELSDAQLDQVAGGTEVVIAAFTVATAIASVVLTAPVTVVAAAGTVQNHGW